MAEPRVRLKITSSSTVTGVCASAAVGMVRASVAIAAVSLDIANPYETFPRGLSILSPRGELWRKLQYRDDAARRWATVEQLLTRPREARWVLPFSPVRTRQLLFVLTYDREWAHPRWSVSELRLFRRCE